MEPGEHRLKNIKDELASWEKLAQKAVGVKGPRNPRDELFDFFYSKLEGSYKAHMKRPLTKRMLAIKLSHLKKDKDLFFLKSICLDAERRGKSFPLVFWSELKVRHNGTT